jgi:putative membrane protein
VSSPRPSAPQEPPSPQDPEPGSAPATSPGTPPGARAPAGGESGWHRLHPLSPVVRSGRHLVTLGFVVVVLIVANSRQAGHDFISDLIVVGVVVLGGVISWLVTRWQVTGGVLYIDTGLIRRQSLRFPLSQVQAIDVVQTGLARVLGLAELRLRMAGADSSGGRLACLRLAEAEQLRQRLLALTRSSGAAGAPGKGAPSAPAGTDGAASAASTAAPAGTASAGRSTVERALAADAGRQLFRVHSGRLAVALVFSRTGFVAAVAIAVMVLVATLSHTPGLVGSILPIGIGVLVAVWRQFNGEFGTTVAAAPEGLRLRSGLVQTTAETIRPGRVQAVRLVEPLIWRAFGWCRLEADVAGPRQRRENRSESQRLRALIPVGSRAQAQQMLGDLVSSQPAPSRRAPASARWKAPLSYHFLAWDGDDRYVAAARGRLCRTTTWVPLEKVQSIRWVQGPVQRRLGLASVRLDVAGRRVTASIQDRGAAEAQEILHRLPDLAREARTRAA